MKISKQISKQTSMNSSIKAWHILNELGVWLLTSFLVFTFLSSGLHNVMAAPNVVEGFQCWGYPDWFPIATGAIEIVAALFLLLPTSASYAAAFLSFAMLGAIATHLRWHEFASSVQPIFLGMLCVLLMFLRRDETFSILNTITVGECK